MGYGLISERFTDPAIELEDLPPIDLVVLSHLHGDHFDRLVEEKLARTLPIVTTHHAARYLEGKGFRPPTALTTWESATFEKGAARLRVSAMPGTHAPGPLRKVLPPVMGSMLEFGTEEGGTRLRLYITGDTLIHKELEEIPERYPEIDLALLHLGGTRVLGVMVTMDDKQGIEMLRIVDPKTVIPIHYNDYTVFKSSSKTSNAPCGMPKPRHGTATYTCTIGGENPSRRNLAVNPRRWPTTPHKHHNNATLRVHK